MREVFMKRYTTADLRRLEIINVLDGSSLGYAGDFEFEAEGDCSRVTALIVCGSDGFFGLGGHDDLYIPWYTIECIGEDTILVKLPPNDYSGCLCQRKRQGRHFLKK